MHEFMAHAHNLLFFGIFWIFGCLNQSLDKQTITARLTWPRVPSTLLTVRLTINPYNRSKGIMADMFIGCICGVQIPGPQQ